MGNKKAADAKERKKKKEKNSMNSVLQQKKFSSGIRISNYEMGFIWKLCKKAALNN